MTTWFLDDDAGYLAWLADHETGFVLNAWPHVTSGYLVLHRAACRTINRPVALGSSWTHQYGKACAETPAELTAWATERTGATPAACRRCQPDIPATLAVRQPPTQTAPRAPRADRTSPFAPTLTGDPIGVTIARLDGGPSLVIEGAQWVAETFFRLDRSASGPTSYDARVRTGPTEYFEPADLAALNGSMATRASLKWWGALLNGVPHPWLSALDPTWDLLQLSDAIWTEQRIENRLAEALAAMIGDHRGLSVATKLLHLKRPALVPILDSLVVDQLGGRGRPGAELIAHVRREGRINLDGLRSIQVQLATITSPESRPIERSLVRILDALLWATHPAAALYPALRNWRSVIQPPRSI